jgi:hypothetical protein
MKSIAVGVIRKSGASLLSNALCFHSPTGGYLQSHFPFKCPTAPAEPFLHTPVIVAKHSVDPQYNILQGKLSRSNSKGEKYVGPRRID